MAISTVQDPKKQWEKISKLTLKELESAGRSGVMAAAKELKKNTQMTLILSHPNATRPNPKWPYEIIMGVLIGKYDKGKLQANVHLMGHRALPGTHRLKWIANGTKERYHKNGKYVGHIDGTPFFRQAILLTPISDIMEKACNKAVNRLNKYK